MLCRPSSFHSGFEQGVRDSSESVFLVDHVGLEFDAEPEAGVVCRPARRASVRRVACSSTRRSNFASRLLVERSRDEVDERRHHRNTAGPVA